MKKEPETLHHDAIDFEVDRGVLLAKSEKRAWNVAKGACLLAVLAITAVALLTPLKSVTPYLVKTNEQTGYTEILTIVDNSTIPKDVALDKYWISNYIRFREHYDWYTLQQDYDNTLLFSSAAVGKQYAAQFQGNQALDVIWGKNITANIDILNIIPDLANGIATVRFSKTINHVESKDKAKPMIWVATLAYKYEPEAPLNMQTRLKNPLGFNVTSYRVDAELVQQVTK